MGDIKFEQQQYITLWISNERSWIFFFKKYLYHAANLAFQTFSPLDPQTLNKWDVHELTLILQDILEVKKNGQ